MTLPKWLPAWAVAAPALWAYGGVALVGGVAYVVHEHNNRVRAEVYAEQAKQREKAFIQQRDSLNAVFTLAEDSLRNARFRVDTLWRATKAASAGYTTARAAVHPEAPGTAPEVVALVKSADMLQARLNALDLATIAERARCDSVISALVARQAVTDSLVVALRTQLKVAGPTFSGRVRDAAIGGAVVSVGLAVIKHFWRRGTP